MCPFVTKDNLFNLMKGMHVLLRQREKECKRAKGQEDVLIGE